jgi:hypothetical protein
MHRGAIRIGEHGNGANAEPPRRPDDPAGDLAAIRR